VGLFDNVLASGSVRNIGMTNVSVTGKWDTGSLIGTNYGTVDSCYAVGGITGESQPGGLVGLNHVSGVIHDSYFIGIVSNPPLVGSCVGGLAGANEGIVNNCHSIGSVTGIERIGGLIGWNGGTIRNCYSNSSSVGNGGMYVGGLIGDNDYIVSNCYATGSVIGDSCVGGLVGQMGYSGDVVVNNSYSTGSVTGNYAVGGLIGSNNGTASNCYATGNVTGTWSVGGLVGENSKVVTNCYAVGNVTCEYDASGGLVAYNSDVGAVTNSFWDTETSGQATSDGGIGKNTTEMQDITTFSGAAWHIIGVDNPSTRNPFYIWNIVDGETYPFLSWEPVS
jgi:hypothetical protein